MCEYKLVSEKYILTVNGEKNGQITVSFSLQYFEYTSQKEIRFNSVTELCAEVLEGQTSIGMRHCPRDEEVRPPSLIWEFKEVRDS